MGKTLKHKIEAKCRQGILNWKDAPMNLQNKWDRHSKEWDEFRALKKKLVEKIMDKEFKTITNEQNY